MIGSYSAPALELAGPMALAQTHLFTREIAQGLHAARVGRNGSQIAFTARVADLPDLVFLTRESAPEQPCLVSEGNLYPWSFSGYGGYWKSVARSLRRHSAPTAAAKSKISSSSI
jgi:hypothetical protein